MVHAIVVEEGRPAELREVDEQVLGEGDVELDVAWSSLNYKDALALSGDPGVVRTSPLVPGIDVVGTVTASRDGRFAASDAVVLTGAGAGETRAGGYAERARVDGASLVHLPAAIDARRAAAIGTAGLTAMLSVLRLERDVAPGSGPVVVTGAAGGVGSVAVALLARLGHEVVASTGRPEHADRLRELGASDVVDRAELSEPGRPVQRPRWAGGVDCVGSTTLASVLAQTRWGGTVTACGLAQGSDLPTTVLPFILRGVTLAGIDSVQAPLALRQEAWDRLATDLDPDLLDALTAEVPLDEVLPLGPEILAGRVRGRTVVRVGA